MYAALARAVLDGTASDQAAARVAKLRERHPRASREQLARRLIHRTALQCGAAGLLWTGPAAFFGAMPFGPDLGYQVVALNRLVLTLSAIYRSGSFGRDKAAGVAAGLGASVAADLLRQGIVRLLKRSLPRRPGARALAGGLAGGVLGYGTAVAVGNLARDVLAGKGASVSRRLAR